MPGPVSDSYDPEFGTAANAHDVKDAIGEVRTLITAEIGDELRNIVEVAQSDDSADGKRYVLPLTEKKLRVIRFCLDYTKDII